MMLDLIDCEQAADFADRNAMLAARVFSGAKLSSDSRKKIFKDISGELEYNELIRQGDLDGAATHRFENSSLASQSVYGFLQEVGLVSPDEHVEETGET